MAFLLFISTKGLLLQIGFNEIKVYSQCSVVLFVVSLWSNICSEVLLVFCFVFVLYFS